VAAATAVRAVAAMTVECRAEEAEAGTVAVATARAERVATAAGSRAEDAGAPMEVEAMAAEVVKEAWAEVWAVPGGRAATEAVAIEAAM